MPPALPSALPIQMNITVAPSKGLEFPLLTAIMEHNDDRKGLSINKELRV